MRSCLQLQELGKAEASNTGATLGKPQEQPIDLISLFEATISSAETHWKLQQQAYSVVERPLVVLLHLFRHAKGDTYVGERAEKFKKEVVSGWCFLMQHYPSLWLSCITFEAQ